MKAPLGEIFAATGIRFIAGMVERIDVEGRQVHVAGAGSDTSQQVIGYDRLVLAAAAACIALRFQACRRIRSTSTSSPRQPSSTSTFAASPRDRPAPGATRWSLPEPGLPASKPQPKCRHAFGRHWAMTPGAHHHGGTQRGCRPRLGPRSATCDHPGPDGTRHQLEAGIGVASVDANGVTLENGERIEADTVVWTAGARANGLTAQVPGIGTILAACTLTPTCASGCARCLRHGRLRLCRNGQRGQLRVDVLPARHEPGPLRWAQCGGGFDRRRLHPHSQPAYVTCLDLGSWGAVYTEGWDRQVKLTEQQERRSRRKSIRNGSIRPPAIAPNCWHWRILAALLSPDRARRASPSQRVPTFSSSGKGRNPLRAESLARQERRARPG